MTWLFFIYVFSYVAQLSVAAPLSHCTSTPASYTAESLTLPKAAPREVMILAGLVGMFFIINKSYSICG